MSLLGVHMFMFRLKTDKALQGKFKNRSPEAFEAFDLTPAETKLLAEADVAELFKAGVHPLLLAPYSRYANIPRPAYIAALAPLKGTRLLRS
jgi:hypothetical protein